MLDVQFNLTAPMIAVNVRILRTDEFAHEMREMFLGEVLSMCCGQTSLDLFCQGLNDKGASHQILTHCAVTSLLERSVEFDDQLYDLADREGGLIDRLWPFREAINDAIGLFGQTHYKTDLIRSARDCVQGYVMGRDPVFHTWIAIRDWMVSEDSRSDREWMLNRLWEAIRHIRANKLL